MTRWTRQVAGLLLGAAVCWTTPIAAETTPANRELKTRPAEKKPKVKADTPLAEYADAGVAQGTHASADQLATQTENTPEGSDVHVASPAGAADAGERKLQQQQDAVAPRRIQVELPDLIRWLDKTQAYVIGAVSAGLVLLLAALALGFAVMATQRSSLAALQRTAATTARAADAPAGLTALNDQLARFEARLDMLIDNARASAREAATTRQGEPAAAPNTRTGAAPKQPALEWVHALVRALEAEGVETVSGTHLEVELEHVARESAARGQQADLAERLCQINFIAPSSGNRTLREQNFLSVVAVRAGADNQLRQIVRVHKEALAGLRVLL